MILWVAQPGCTLCDGPVAGVRLGRQLARLRGRNEPLVATVTIGFKKDQLKRGPKDHARQCMMNHMNDWLLPRCPRL